MLITQNGIHIALQRRGRLRIAINQQRRLLRLHAILIVRPDIRRPINGIAVLEDVDVVRDGPVDGVDGRAGVEEDRVALCQGVLGEGGGGLHVGLAAGVGAGGLIDKEALQVHVLRRAGCRVPVLVVADVRFEFVEGHGAGADVGAAGAAVVAVGGLQGVGEVSLLGHPYLVVKKGCLRGHILGF